MAAQIKVNDATWKALSKEHQEAITDIISQSFGDVSIHPDAATPLPAVSAAAKLPGGVCNLLCQIGAAAGHIGCERLPSPAKELCNSGVDAAEVFCKSKCH
jgi:hypothetical protein